jgi:hypothetical protein
MEGSNETTNEREQVSLNTTAINKHLSLDKVYDYTDPKGGKIYIKKVNNQITSCISGKKFNYIGEMDQNFERSGLGKNIYAEGDIFLGFWENNEKKRGIYYHIHLKDNPDVFIGEWEGQSKHRGVYIWNSGNDAFVGFYENGRPKQGLFISGKQDDNNIHFYLGKIDRDHKKNDSRAFYYIPQTKKIFYGEINDNALVKGHVVEVNQEGILNDPFYYEKDAINESEAIDQSEQRKYTEIFQTFLMHIKPELVENVKETFNNALKLKDDFNSPDDLTENEKFKTEYDSLNHFPKMFEYIDNLNKSTS